MKLGSPFSRAAWQALPDWLGLMPCFSFFVSSYNKCFAYMRGQTGPLAEIPVARAEISAAFS